MAKTKTKALAFEAAQMELNMLKLLGSSSKREVEAHFKLPLDEQTMMDLDLDGILQGREVDMEKGVPLKAESLFGKMCKIQVATAPDEDGNKGLLIEKRPHVEAISAKAKATKKGPKLTLVMGIPLANDAEVWFLVDYLKRDLFVTIWPGAKQTTMDMEEK